MMTVYVNWENQEILTQEKLDEKRDKLLDLTKELGKDNFEEFYDSEGYYKIEYLIEIMVAEDKQTAVEDLMTSYEFYVDNQLNINYEKITLD